MMNKIKRLLICVLFLGATGIVTVNYAQEKKTEVAEGLEASDEAVAPKASGFLDVVTGAGIVGIILWLALLGTSLAGFALIVDSFLQVREKKMIPDGFVEKIQEALEQGDILKATNICEQEPNPMGNILEAAFTNVEDGFEAAQDAVTVTGDLESEKLMQRVNYLNVVGNLAPMLGLLGTVQGMIYAFATLATAGAAAASLLAMNISQALYTTAAGLMIAIPALAFFYFFKNKASKIVLNMEMLTLSLIRGLRHVEIEVED